jgi:hypothetical protein
MVSVDANRRVRSIVRNRILSHLRIATAGMFYHVRGVSGPQKKKASHDGFAECAALEALKNYPELYLPVPLEMHMKTDYWFNKTRAVLDLVAYV